MDTKEISAASKNLDVDFLLELNKSS
ncbi:hypothetical protein MNBD_GAMMA17-369 [hydrothermal vent metagenome]|uniref:Uncharacterized protein n=1 Tax=hydrothermal vent metagenome TaxID=652676 RepID=A0A3B0ZSU6_9ZZZZ